MKDEGLRPGQPDVCLPVPRRAPDGSVYGACYLELKDLDGALRESQRRRIRLLRAVGNYVEVAMSMESARALLLHYLSLPRP
ncbi:MAG: hypothetical protein JWO05_1162 [Gemmatimonadetes bacterium]|nr:hypothetical protein [Gemmatimonadota bacterium]